MTVFKRYLTKIIENPRYAAAMIKLNLYQKYLGHSIYAAHPDLRSDSDNGLYISAVHDVLYNDRNFQNFKRRPAYMQILEHVSRLDGQKYLDILQNRTFPIIDDSLMNILEGDTIGNPVKYRYPGFRVPLSPSTLRYVKITSDLHGLFGSKFSDVAEIGCGYGGQCLVNDQLLRVERAYLFDLHIVNKLIEKYLENYLLSGAYFTQTINQTSPKNYDLVISNYAFSELPSFLQRRYIEKVMSRATRGYLTMNSGIGGPHDSGKLSLNELRSLLPKFEVYEHQPFVSDYYYLIVWGHGLDFARRNFTMKVI